MRGQFEAGSCFFVLQFTISSPLIGSTWFTFHGSESVDDVAFSSESLVIRLDDQRIEHKIKLPFSMDLRSQTETRKY